MAGVSVDRNDRLSWHLQHVPRERWAIRQCEAQRALAASDASAAMPKCARWHAILVPKQCVETPQALEPACVCDARHRKIGVYNETLSQKQPMRLRELERGDPQLALQG